MASLLEAGLAGKYFVDDLPGAAVLGARLNGILQKIEAGAKLTALAQSFLETNGLRALYALSLCQIDLGTFRIQAAQEREVRVQRTKARAAEVAAQLARQAEASAVAMKAHFAAMDNDPVLRRKRESRQLRERFNIGFIDSEHLRRVMALLKQVANGQRLGPEDVAWLSTEASDCWTEALRKAWHLLEAEALSKAWENGCDPWDAVNASGHWRKAGKPDAALAVTEAALSKAFQSPKIRSALATTRGGAMRDLLRFDDAAALGLDAHKLTPSDFRPCTLLGAVHIELGDYLTGYKWYQKAEKLGAKRHAVDQDLRALIVRADPKEKHNIRKFLLDQDSERFAWLRA